MFKWILIPFRLFHRSLPLAVALEQAGMKKFLSFFFLRSIDFIIMITIIVVI